MCALQSLETKVGKNEYKKWEDTQKDEHKKEKETDNNIQEMRMKRNTYICNLTTKEITYQRQKKKYYKGIS